jgi:branched-chain amino acid aminotransferase
MNLARQEGHEVREEVLARYDLYTADEVFLTGTAAEIIGVIKLDNRTIGNGRPGKITRKLEHKFRELAETQGVEIK